MNPSLLNAADLAARTGEHLSTIRRRTRRGDYADFALNIGTPTRPKWRYDARRLDRWLDAHRVA